MTTRKRTSKATAAPAQPAPTPTDPDAALREARLAATPEQHREALERELDEALEPSGETLAGDLVDLDADDLAALDHTPDGERSARFIRLVLAELVRRVPAGALDVAVVHAATELDAWALDELDAVDPDARPHLVLPPSWNKRATCDDA